MALPASFLNQVEHHSCFSGCYGSELDARVCLDPAQPPEPAIFISCRDCLTYKAGVLRSLLPPGISSDALADQVTQHMRQVRGFQLSFGGYHMRGGGFWLNAVYYDACGLFLIDGSRSRATGSDLDLLLLAFRQGVAQPSDPRMTDPKLYQTQVIYVDFTVPVVPILAKQDLLSSAQCRLHPATGFHRVTLAEFMPIAALVGVGGGAPMPVSTSGPPVTAPAQPSLIVTPTSAAPGSAAQAGMAAMSAGQGQPPPSGAQATAPSGMGQQPGGSAPSLSPASGRTRPGKLRLGDICPVCHAELKERSLFTGTFVGCLC